MIFSVGEGSHRGSTSPRALYMEWNRLLKLAKRDFHGLVFYESGRF